MKPEKGYFNFLPITFDEEHFSVVNVLIHSVTMDLKFRPAPLWMSAKEDVVMVVLANSAKDKEKSLKKQASPIKLCKSFEEALFPKGVSVSNLDPTYLGKIYDDFVQRQIDMNDAVKERIDKIKKKFIAEIYQPEVSASTVAVVRTEADTTVSSEEAKSDEESKVASAKEEEQKQAKQVEETKEATLSPKEAARKKWVALAQSSENTSALTAALLSELGVWSNSINQLWNQYLEAVIQVPHQIAQMLCEEFNNARVGCFGHFVHHSEYKAPSFPFIATRDVSAEHQALTKVIRGSILSRGIDDDFNLKELSVFSKLDEVPILFEEVFMRDTEAKSVVEEVYKGRGNGEGHLLVFVHGYQGNS